MLGLIIASAPWIIGTGLGFSSTLLRGHSLGYCLVLAGIGGYVSFLVISFCIFITNNSGTSIFREDFALGLTAIAVLISAWAVLLISRSRRISDAWRYSALRASDSLFLIPILLLIAHGAFQALWTPTFGWDVLSFWSKEASKLLVVQSTVSPEAYELVHRHPFTLVAVISWFGWCFHHFNSNFSPFLGWFLLWTSLAFMTFGFAISTSRSTRISCLLAIASLTIPLLSNHTLVGGYAEIFLTVCLFGSSSLVCFGLKAEKPHLIIFGLILGCTAVVLKNTGLFYVCVLALGVASLKLKDILLPAALITALFFGFLLYLVAIESTDMYVLGNVIGFDVSERKFLFAGRWLVVEEASLIDILRNQLTSTFRNASFTILPSLFLSVLGFAIIKRGQIDSQLYFLVSVMVIGILLATLSQFTEHGFKYATPTSDTGNTRLLLPLFPLSLLLLPPLYRKTINKSSNL